MFCFRSSDRVAVDGIGLTEQDDFALAGLYDKDSEIARQVGSDAGDERAKAVKTKKSHIVKPERVDKQNKSRKNWLNIEHPIVAPKVESYPFPEKPGRLILWYIVRPDVGMNECKEYRDEQYASIKSPLSISVKEQKTTEDKLLHKCGPQSIDAQ